MKKYLKLLLILGLGLQLFSQPLHVAAQESEIINQFNSEIIVGQDGWLDVTETIEVLALNQAINHGIYRDFPTIYRNNWFLKTEVPLEIISIMRNGEPEPYHTKRMYNGVRIYIGSADYSITAGIHTYIIKYRTNNQLGFFEDHDELYWNVTGNGWEFPIENATATVILPPTVPVNSVTYTSYTGPFGSTENNATSTMLISLQSTGDRNAIIKYETTRTLDTHEGLTIVIGWAKGIIAEPSDTQKWLALVQSNAGTAIGLFGCLLILAYYLTVWKRHGKDPEAGTIIPEYEPPLSLSAAETRHIVKMHTDNKAFVSQIISMAIKGLITIEQVGKKYKLKIDKTDKASELEAEIIKKLSPKIETGIELDNKHYKKIAAANKVLSDHAKAKFSSRYFKKNWGYIAKGLLLSLTITVLMFVFGAFDVWPIILLVILALINLIFGMLMDVRTKEGRKLLDQIEGFKWFLSVTEKDRMNFHNPPEKTPELFEKFLPFALALGVENQWAEQFSDVFARLEQQGRAYTPTWYHGHYVASNPAGFAHTMGHSFATTVASSSHAPGSSSGSSGGSSGGGGGGGGGGGW